MRRSVTRAARRCNRMLSPGLLGKAWQRGHTAPPDIIADIAGVKVVELVARQSGSDAGPVLATWAEARAE